MRGAEGKFAMRWHGNLSSLDADANHVSAGQVAPGQASEDEVSVAGKPAIDSFLVARG